MEPYRGTLRTHYTALPGSHPRSFGDLFYLDLSGQLGP